MQRLVVASVAAACLVPIGLAAGFHRPAPQPCVVAIGIDRTGSQNNPVVSSEREANALAILQAYRTCDYALIEPVRAHLGESNAWMHRLRGEGAAPLDAQDDARRNLELAEAQIRQIYEDPGEGRTSYLDWFREASGTVAGTAGGASVQAFLLGDAIDTEDPDDMVGSVFTSKSINRVVDSIAPTLTLRNWVVHFVGVNQTGRGTADRVAQNASAFWNSLIPACGGRLASYSLTYAR